VFRITLYCLKHKNFGANMKTSIKKFLKDDTGVTAIEYGLIAGLIVAGIALSLGTIGKDLVSIFGAIANSADTAKTAAGGT
jgi:pilus assembly protein Flp/PilA